MTEHFSNRMLGILLMQVQIAASWRNELIERFHYGSPDWLTLLSLELPAELKDTTDLFLRTMRRLARQDYGELSAYQREAFIEAPDRLFGIHEAMLAEALAGSSPDSPTPIAEDADFALHIELLPKNVREEEQPALVDLRVRGLAEGARRLVATGDLGYSGILAYAYKLSLEGTGNTELAATLIEILAYSLEKRGKLADAVMERSVALEMLYGHPLADRVAEAVTDLADVYLQFDPGNHLSLTLYEDAAARLEKLPAGLNLPLRRRLASALRIG